MNEPIAFLDDQFVPVSQARLHVFDLGVVGGVAVTEMVRTFRHALFRFDDHLARLAASCRSVGFVLPKPIAEIRALSEKIVSRNARLLDVADDLGLIIFVTAGLNPTYVGRDAARRRGATLGIHTFPLPWELWRDKFAAGLSLAVPNVRNIPPTVIDPRVKHRSRLHWWLADRAAREIDPLASALVLDDQGLIAETAAGNFCAVCNGVVCSPKPGTVLEGVSLAVVRELCERLRIPFERRDLTLVDALAAQECFVTSTPPCLLPVTRINATPIGDGAPGPLTQTLLQAWSDLVGVDIPAQMQPPS
jgi:branched-subunit amino acid aminotransferase/4-amino-4-deoxychorismate lyase